MKYVRAKKCCLPKDRRIFRDSSAHSCLHLHLNRHCILPHFSWTNNALSDLGVVPGITGSLFNFGLLASGILAFNFAIFGLYTYFGKSWVGKIGSVVFAAATLALIAISVFNEHFSPTHYLGFCSILHFGAHCPFHLNRCVFAMSYARIGGFHGCGWNCSSTAVAFALRFNYVPNVAIPEFLSGLAVSAWAIVLGIKMLRSKV